MGATANGQPLVHQPSRDSASGLTELAILVQRPASQVFSLLCPVLTPLPQHTAFPITAKQWCRVFCRMSSCFSGTSNTVPSDQEHPVATHGESLVNAADGKSCSETTAVSTDDDCYKVMTLDPKDDPQQFHIGRKWLITLTICNTSLCATFVSSVVCDFRLAYTLSLTRANFRAQLQMRGYNAHFILSTRSPCSV